MCPVFREQPYHGGKLVYLILLKRTVRLGEVKGAAPVAVASLERKELGVQPGSLDSGACTVPAQLCFGRVPLSDPDVPSRAGGQWE